MSAHYSNIHISERDYIKLIYSNPFEAIKTIKNHTGGIDYLFSGKIKKNKVKKILKYLSLTTLLKRHYQLINKEKKCHYQLKNIKKEKNYLDIF